MSESFIKEKDIKENKHYLIYTFLIVNLIIFIIISVMPIVDPTGDMAITKNLPEIAWALHALSYLLLPFIVKDKKKRILAIIVAVVIVALMLSVRYF